MLEHKAKPWLRTVTILTREIAGLSLADDSILASRKTLDGVAKTLRMVLEQAQDIGLAVSCNMIVEDIYFFERSDTQAYPRLVKQQLEGILSAITNELATIKFYRLKPEFAKYHSILQPFGPIVSDTFPEAIKDIEEGAKALSLGLGTACVFHMMRIMEVALKALAKEIGMSNLPSWESYIDKIDKGISANYKTKSRKWKKNQKYYAEIFGDLQAIKIAWRNPTMHIERHYDQDEAEDVFRATKNFLSRFAKHLSGAKSS